MKSRKRIIAMLLVSLMLVASFAGCAKKDPTAVPATPTTAANDTPDANTPASSTPSGPGVQHDVVNVGISSDIGSFNPFNFTGGGPTLAMWGIYQSLGYMVDGVYYPSLMKEYTISDDGLLISGVLYDNIHDWAGNKLTAEDIAWSYQMAVDGNTAGTDDFVEKCVATGDYTFEFQLKKQMQVGRFDKILQWFAVSKKAYEESTDSMNTTPVGTGPYKLTSYTSGYSFTYEKVADYWQTDETQIYARDKANVNNINYFVIPESTQRAIALQNGTIDMCGEIATNDLPTFADSDKFNVVSVPDNLSLGLMPNCGEGSLLHDINLRLAICYATDADGLLNSVYGGDGTTLHSISPSWAVGVDPSWEKEDNYYIYNSEKAKDYLSKSSYNGETLKVMCTAGEVNTNASQLIMALLDEIGIKTTLTSLEDATFREAAKDATQWDIIVNNFATNTYYLDAAYGNFSLVRTTWNGSQNFIFDDTFQDMLSTISLEQNASQENIQKLHDYIIDNCYFMGLVNWNNKIVVPSWCSDVTLSQKKTLVPGGCTYTE